MASISSVYVTTLKLLDEFNIFKGTGNLWPNSNLFMFNNKISKKKNLFKNQALIPSQPFCHKHGVAAPSHEWFCQRKESEQTLPLHSAFSMKGSSIAEYHHSQNDCAKDEPAGQMHDDLGRLDRSV